MRTKGNIREYFTCICRIFYLLFVLLDCHKYAKVLVTPKHLPPPPHASVSCAGILEQPMGARNRVGIGLSYRPARDCIFKLRRSLAGRHDNSVPPRFLAPIDCFKIRAQASSSGGVLACN
jgi:hypothetical protein